MSQIEIFTETISLLFVLDSSTWNHLTVCKQMKSNLFKNKVTYKLFT